MTGFGVGHSVAGADELTIEVKSVNHKFLEVKARLPRELSSLEPAIQKQVKTKLVRGAVDVLVKRSGGSSSSLTPSVDESLARAYVGALRQLAQATEQPFSVSLEWLAERSGVLRLEETTVNIEAAAGAVAEALEKALDALLRMRQTEGAAIATDLSARLDFIALGVVRLKAETPRVIEQFRERLRTRVAELTSVAVDPSRLEQEIVLMVDRTDVAEEMTRLDSHLNQFRSLLSSTEPSGRKMEFLVQEMHREVNTTGSKSQDASMAMVVVGLKAELERIREQVANIE